jgi:diadenosine tetraphosphatase ApaH/serine/threonine PP2A family protein phosphatase
MKIAVISCIHGNIKALNEVLRDIDRNTCDKIYCLGDLVGYGLYPNEVVETISALAIPTVQGCWDEDIVEGLNACECSYPSLLAERRGRLAHEWTDRQMLPENRDFLAQLPHTLKDNNLCFVHGSPLSNHEYLLPQIDSFTALERVLSSGADILFCGHTHVPYVRSLASGNLQVRLTEPQRQEHLSFAAPLKRIVNVGSVGEPRHGRPNATYAIYDTQTDAIVLREIEYDYQSVCAEIIEVGLPPIFAWRLARGLEFAEKADDPTHICQR